MSVNNEYKRYFIILQEDEKGFEFSAGKMPTGYVKIEVKNGKGKLTAFIQNVKSDERLEYRLLLVAPNRRTAVDVGKAIIDGSGRGEIYYEFESDNVLGSGLNISEYMVAAVSAGNGLPLSGYVGRDKLDWKNKYEIINRSKEPRKDKKAVPIEEIPMVQQMPVIEKHTAPVQEIMPQQQVAPHQVQKPAVEAIPQVVPKKIEKKIAPIEEIPMFEQPLPKIEKKVAPIQEIPAPKPKKQPVEEIPKVKKEKVPIEEIPIAEEIPIIMPAPEKIPQPPQLNIQPKIELKLEPIVEIKQEKIMMNQINIEQVEAVEPEEEYVPCEPLPCEKKMPCQIDYDYYYDECDSSDSDDSDSDDKPKKHGHHDKHCKKDEYDYYECGCEDDEHDKHHDHHCDDDEHDKHHDHHSDDDDHDEYEYNPYYSSNMYKHLRALIKRLRRCEPFHEEDRDCEWFMVRNEIYMMNDIAVPFMGKMLPLGYPFMMEDCMMTGRRDYILGICYDRECEGRRNIKHIMFGVQGVYNKMNERYYMSRGFSRFRKHKERNYGYWIMCLDIRNGMLKR